MTSSAAPGPGPLPATGPASPRVADRYPNLGTRGVSVSSRPQADVAITTSRVEGWVVATGLLLAGALAMGIYVLLLHHT